jgi:hypothetical protein
MRARSLKQILLLMLLFIGGSLAALARTPEIELPPSAKSFSVGENIVLNGLPMRMRGFHAQESLHELKAWFLRRLGERTVENHWAGGVILGKAEGKYYLTVQLKPGREGVDGVVAISDFRTGDTLERYRERTNRLLSGLPHDSMLISDMTAQDGNKSSWHAVVANRQGAQLNSERVQGWLTGQGFVLEHEARTDGDGRSLYFKGAGKEAIVTIAREPDRQTVIVINTVSTLSAFR